MQVLLIDDSAYARSEMKDLLESIPAVRAVSTAIDGVDGFGQAVRLSPDIIILDLEMPNMDGFTFLRLLGDVRKTPVIVVSGLGLSENSSRAIALGAYEFIEKPDRSAGLRAIRAELEKTLRLIPLDRAERRAAGSDSTRPPAAPPEAVVIGASTGGPGAVSAIIKSLPAGFSIPVMVSIHFPEWLTRAIVERLEAESAVEVRRAEDGEPVRGGVVLIAPGGHHLTFFKSRGSVYTRLIRKRAEELYAPSVDRMFASAAGVWGGALTGVIMTGMGNDGESGAVEIKERGGYLIAESEESSMVFSMPGAAISTGVVDQVLSAEEIGGWLLRKVEVGELKLA